jgi:hypothetical protein
MCLEPPKWDQPLFTRMCDGLTSVLLALKRAPIIAYQKNSSVAEKMAAEIEVMMHDSICCVCIDLLTYIYMCVCVCIAWSVAEKMAAEIEVMTLFPYIVYA